jgi:hypothetical protein
VSARRFNGFAFRSKGLRRGWVRGPALQRGHIFWFARRFEGAGVVAIALTSGLDPHGDPAQQIVLEKAFFVPQQAYRPNQEELVKEPLALDAVPAVAFSETTYDLARMTGAGPASEPD